MKILFWDGWMGGIHNFLPLHKTLQDSGVESLLVHRGSWGADPDRPKEEVVDGMLCRELRYYRTNNFYKVLRQEQPDAIVILTTTYIADRAVILAARALGIKSFYLMCGVLETGDETVELQSLSNPALLAARWKNAAKYLRYTLPNYFYSGIRNDISFPFRLSPYALIWNTFRNPARYLYHPPPSSEIHCDHALVWANVYADHLHDAWGYPHDRIDVVGHPPLDAVLRVKKQPQLSLERESLLRSLDLSPETSFVVFLESPFVEQHMGGWTDELRKTYYQEIADSCAAAGRQLVLKLHPCSSFKSPEFLRMNPNARVVGDCQLAELVCAAESVVGFSSTTLNIPIMLDIPVFRPCWGAWRNTPDYFSKHGVIRDVQSPQHLSEALQHPAAHRVPRDKLQAYIERYITKVDGSSIHRITDRLLACVLERAEVRKAA